MWSVKHISLQKAWLLSGRKQEAASCLALSWPWKALSWPQATPILRKVHFSFNIHQLVFPSWGPGYREFSFLWCGVGGSLLERACTPSRKAEHGVLSTTLTLTSISHFPALILFNNWRCLPSLSWHLARPTAGGNGFFCCCCCYSFSGF